MFDRYRQRTFLPQNRMQIRVPGLRETTPQSVIKVYRAKPDGTPGELLRIEYPGERRTK